MAEFSLEDVITESKHFLITRSPRPFVSREEGGHIRIFPKRDGVRSINDLSQEESIDLIMTERTARKVMMEVLPQCGVPVVWINILDLGNWAFKRNEEPRLHMHVFGRVANAKKQVWPEAPQLPDRSSGFYEGNVPLSASDMDVLRKKINSEFSLIQFRKG